MFSPEQATTPKTEEKEEDSLVGRNVSDSLFQSMVFRRPQGEGVSNYCMTKHAYRMLIWKLG